MSDLNAMREETRRLLAERRPDRYVVSGAGDDDTEDDVLTNAWLDDIAEDVKELGPDNEVRTVLARAVVAQEEGKATRRANDLLRRIRRSGQLVLDWFDAKDWPLAVITTYEDETTGDRKKLEERVALRAATADDLRAFANDERARAARDFTARNDACEGAEWVAEQMDAAGAVTFIDWADPDDGESE